MTELDYAEKWFQLHNITYFIDDGSIYLQIGGIEFQISTAEANYRAELFLESELEGVKVN
tara:strand:- start:114 stop:293 length:180 start_codon:yes stop_codon:yes gene_type:complete